MEMTDFKAGSRPSITDIQVGDVIRLDGLSVPGRQPNEGRTFVWGEVKGTTIQGGIYLSVLMTEGEIVGRAPHFLNIPVSDLVAMIAMGAARIVEKAGD